jgi:hypothetical protein
MVITSELEARSRALRRDSTRLRRVRSGDPVGAHNSVALRERSCRSRSGERDCNQDCVTVTMFASALVPRKVPFSTITTGPIGRDVEEHQLSGTHSERTDAPPDPERLALRRVVARDSGRSPTARNPPPGNTGPGVAIRDLSRSRGERLRAATGARVRLMPGRRWHMG